MMGFVSLNPSYGSKLMTKILQTPPHRFANLPGFPYHAHGRADLPGYAGLSMAYIDEGPATAPVFLCFGRSEKPADDAVYTFDFHRNSLVAFVRALDLKDVTLVVKDWGGLFGLTLPMEMPERFGRLIVM